MPDELGNKLPPLTKDSLDGEKQESNLEFKQCSHSMAQIVNNRLQCQCGVGWQGPSIHLLYEALQRDTLQPSPNST